MEQELQTLLNADLQELSLPLPTGADALLLDFLDKVLQANEVMNLTAITDKREAIHKHLVDSLSVLMLKDLKAQITLNSLWVDVGSGAGFPGMALALAAPSAVVHLIESTGKKAHFLSMASAELGLMKRVLVHNERAEALAQIPASARAGQAVPRGTDPQKGSLPASSVPRGTLRGMADACFFRGVSRLASLVELGAPLLKINGLLIAYKGPKASEEISEAAKVMKELKVELVERKDFSLPGVQEARVLLCLKKTGETPKRFPRPIGMAQKEPIL